MREYQDPIIQTKAEFLDIQFKEWLANSHFWIRDLGTFVCKWCKKPTTATLIGDGFLCMENPEIKKLINNKDD